MMDGAVLAAIAVCLLGLAAVFVIGLIFLIDRIEKSRHKVANDMTVKIMDACDDTREAEARLNRRLDELRDEIRRTPPRQ